MAMMLVTLAVLLMVVAAMSVGVMFGRKPLAGSCGGVGRVLNEKNYVCDFCGNDENRCKELNADDESDLGQQQNLSYAVAAEAHKPDSVNR